jgi:hypothetical protein
MVVSIARQQIAVPGTPAPDNIILSANCSDGHFQPSSAYPPVRIPAENIPATGQAYRPLSGVCFFRWQKNNQCKHVIRPLPDRFSMVVTRSQSVYRGLNGQNTPANPFLLPRRNSRAAALIAPYCQRLAAIFIVRLERSDHLGACSIRPST